MAHHFIKLNPLYVCVMFGSTGPVVQVLYMLLDNIQLQIKLGLPCHLSSD